MQPSAPPLACAVRGRACQLQARRCCVGRPRELVLRVNLKRYGSSRLDDKLHPPWGEPRQPAEAQWSSAGRRPGAERTGLAFYLPACSCRRAGVHPYPPPSPLSKVADCPPAGSNRGQLAHVAPPPVPPRVPGAFVALDSGPSVKQPPPVAQVGDAACDFVACWGLRRHPQWRVGDGAHGPDNQLHSQCECGAALKHAPAPLCPLALTG